MGMWFDDLTRAMATSMPRRGVLRVLAGTVAGTAGLAMGSTSVEAACSCQGKICPPGTTCNERQGCACVPSGGGCTPSNPNFCNGVCCQQGQSCVCGRCCSAVCQAVGGTLCCPPGTFCAGGQCCPSAQMCGGIAFEGIGQFCCPTGTNCVTAFGIPMCCPTAQTCGPICCPGGTVCLGVFSGFPLCCPTGQLCAGLCCPPGHTCVAGACQEAAA